VKILATAGTVLLLAIGALMPDNPASTSSTTPIAIPSDTPSASPSLVRVPPVKGLGLTKSKRKLRAAGLEVGKIDRRPSGKRKGTVLKQGVDKGAEMEPGSSAALVVAVPLPRVRSGALPTIDVASDVADGDSLRAGLPRPLPGQLDVRRTAQRYPVDHHDRHVGLRQWVMCDSLRFSNLR
jgi:hypothetical protein